MREVSKPYGVVYVLTSPSGKQYVGQTMDLRQRLSLHRSRVKHEERYHSLPIYSAIRKYDIENFLVDVIDEAKDRESLNFKEKFWIKRLGTIAPSGYNLTDGGEGGPKSEETRKKMSESAKTRYKRDPDTSHISERNRRPESMTDEIRNKISQTLLERNKGRLFVHSTTGYRNRCRCRVCKDAIAAYARRRKRKRIEEARAFKRKENG